MSDDRYTVQGWHSLHTLITADYHRNGSGGDGFYVALVDSKDYDETETHRFLLTWFPEYSDDDNEVLTEHQTRVSVLRVDQIHTGNIHMFPGTNPTTGETLPGTGGAAYRGADNWDKVIPLIRLYLDDERAMRDRVFQADLASRAHAQ